MESYEGFKASGLRPGDKLANGAIVVATTKVRKTPGSMEHGILLAILPENNVTPWVSWCFNTNRDPEGNVHPEGITPYWGNYAYSWKMAVTDFTERTEGWLIDNEYPPEVDNV